MTRHIMPITDVMHTWFSQTQEWAKNGRNSVSFKDNVLYSYNNRYPIGLIYHQPPCEQCVLINSNTFSRTTRKHISWAKGTVDRHNYSNKPQEGLSVIPIFEIPLNEIYKHEEFIENWPLHVIINYHTPWLLKKGEAIVRSRSMARWHLISYDSFLKSANNFIKFFHVKEYPNGLEISHKEQEKFDLMRISIILEGNN